MASWCWHAPKGLIEQAVHIAVQRQKGITPAEQTTTGAEGVERVAGHRYLPEFLTEHARGPVPISGPNAPQNREEQGRTLPQNASAARTFRLATLRSCAS